MQNESSELLGHRYRLLDKLGDGGMGVVYRAFDRLAGRHVALKRVHARRRRGAALATQEVFGETMATPEAMPASDSMIATGPTVAPVRWGPAITERDALAFRMALAQEFHTLASLRHPNIISVLDYGFDAADEPFFTMELLADARPLLATLVDRPLAQRIEVLAQVLRALDYLHRRGTLHRDLKPSNILLLLAGKAIHAKVLDFGIALEETSGDTGGQTVAGTLGYMAPELFRGEPPSAGSDLYAIGVLAYELLSGRHPFSTEDDRVLVHAIQHQEPQREPLGANATIADWTLQLLSRNPAARFRNAQDALRALTIATGQPLPLESVAVREGYLQAARFVGRHAELSTLKDALETAKRGQGSTFLVGGESGVGKSRLLDELRTLGLVRGMRVLRGQAEGTAGTARQPFLELARALALDTPLSDEEASVLKLLVPDLPELLGRDIADAPALGPQATQMRFLRVLVHFFTRSDVPVLMILEDLQWAPAESLGVLKAVTAIIATRPMLLVASFRDDERPEIPQLVPGARLLKLLRFEQQAICELSTSMLGTAGAKPEVLALLSRETAGNAFFMVEVVRALAEEAGSLDEVGKQSLPRQVFASGVQAVVQRRLARVPEWAQSLLKLAAVAGRRIERSTLAALEPKLDEWLQVCADSAILEIADTEWQFAHDKLREHLLTSLEKEERKRLHRRFAEAMEQVHGTMGPHVGILGYHFDEAGEWIQAEKYLTQAGTIALRRGGLQRAVELLARALQLQEQIGATKLQQAVTQRRLSKTYYGLGQVAECKSRARQAMALLDRPMPQTPFQLWRSIGSELATEIKHRLIGTRPLDDPMQRALSQEFVTLNRAIGETNFVTSNFAEVFYLMLRVLHAAEVSSDITEQVNHFAYLAFVAYSLPWHKLGIYYLRQAQHLLPQAPPRLSLGTYHAMSGYMAFSEGRWQECLAAFASWLETVEKGGDEAQKGLMLTSRAAALLMLGESDRVVADAEACIRIGRRLGNQQLQAYGLGWQALTKRFRGELEAAETLLDKSQELIDAGARSIDKAIISGLCALSACLRGDLVSARSRLDVSLRRLRRGAAPTPQYFVGYASVADASLILLRDASSQTEQAEDRQRLRQALWQLGRLAFVFPVARPRAFQCVGRALLLNGHTWLGLRCLMLARSEATRFSLPYEDALTAYHLGCARALKTSERRANLQQAMQIFQRLGAGWDLKQAQTALQQVEITAS